MKNALCCPKNGSGSQFAVTPSLLQIALGGMTTLTTPDDLFLEVVMPANQVLDLIHGLFMTT
jgi:hypothetical protein